MRYDVAIIGCGITGAAAAYQLSRYDLRVVVLEKENDVSLGATRANSAILHAGYDPEPNSLMAKLNVKGSAMAKELCKALDVPYGQVGSLVAAFSEEELPTLQKLYENGKASGVPGLRLLSGPEARELEPGLAEDVKGALYAPSAAIVDPWEYCLALAETAVKNGVEVRTRSEVTGAEKLPDGGWRLMTAGGAVETRFVLAAAGTHCADVHKMAGEPYYEVKPAKGQYYLLDKPEGRRVSHVVFQCPGPAGKGVLVAPTVHGNLIVGPTAEASGPDDTANTAAGLEAVRRLSHKSVPGIQFGENIRNFAGVRANTTIDDFILGQITEGFYEAAGIRSPGLSAAPAVAEFMIAAMQRDGLELREKAGWDGTRRRVRFKGLSAQEKNALIQKDPSYGRVVCRCETITEG
ncbi:MAG: NAD(P)/FAD-dependent oxidoreductase, partial [Oscillospiraceae bacterium]|nr:NAD(P)/FAD-dependent oxidoreductase [Oscillospiraceae bacterium]